MKLRDFGVVWILDTSIYVADKSLYNSADKFLNAVLRHIGELIKSHSEAECGWFVIPVFAEYLPKVSVTYMRRALPSEEYSWQMEDKPGKGHRPVWSIDF